MKHISLSALILALSVAAALGQNEQAPIVEKEFEYKNWIQKDVRTDEAMALREMVEGKKLVVVVYFAPWCPNWRNDAPMLQRLYNKYKDSGLEFIGVSEYDPVEVTRANLKSLKITFPVVYESTSRMDKIKTKHFAYRIAAGDTRGWGSPWYIFLEPAKLPKSGDVLTTRASVINGEMIEAEADKFIREKLGLPPEKSVKASVAAPPPEVCEPAKPTAKLKAAPKK